jgi:hypothetical protein
MTKIKEKKSISNIKTYNYITNNLDQNININLAISKFKNSYKHSINYMDKNNKKNRYLIKNKNDRSSFEEKKTMYKSNSMNKILLNNKITYNLKNLQSQGEINQYSFKKVPNHNDPYKTVKNAILNKNNNVINKDSLILLRSTNSASFRNKAYNYKDKIININSFFFKRKVFFQFIE